jgi:hypothetical protein
MNAYTVPWLHLVKKKVLSAASVNHLATSLFAYLQANQAIASELQRILLGSKQFTAAHALGAAAITSQSPLQAARALRINELLGFQSSATLSKANRTAQLLAIDYWAQAVLDSSSAAHVMGISRGLFRHSAESYHWLLRQPTFMSALSSRAQKLPSDSRQQLFDLLVAHIDISMGRLERQYRGAQNPVETPSTEFSQPLLPAQTHLRWPSAFWGSPQSARTAADGTTFRVYAPETMPDPLRRLAGANLALGNPVDYPGLNSSGQRTWVNEPQEPRTFMATPGGNTSVIAGRQPQRIEGLPPEPALRDIFSLPGNYSIIAEPSTYGGESGKFRLGTVVVQLIERGRVAVIGRLQNASYSADGQAYNRDLGPQLIRESVVLADRLGVQMIRIEADDERRMRLYRAMGAQVVQTTPTAEGKNTYIMELDLVNNTRFRQSYGLGPRQ